MNILNNPKLITPEQQRGVVTIGKFDGLHLGHQKSIVAMKKAAQTSNAPHTLITFEPSPLEYFSSQNTVARLTPFTEKMRLLKNYGVENCLCLHFDQSLAQQTATEFVQDLLIDQLKIKHIIIGDDFQFGANRQGNIALLKRMGQQAGFRADNLDTVKLKETRVSSTRVRNALQQGDLHLAQQLLNRDYAITGRVIYGAQKGRTIGFPTANLSFKQHQPPMTGVFVVTVSGIKENVCEGMANIGTRPTVHGIKPLLEVHLFDFNDTLYGQRITIHFKKKLREEQRFPSFEALQKQIQHDAIRAREYFKYHCSY